MTVCCPIVRRTCAADGCSVTFNGHANRKYHSRTCQEREAKRRYRAKGEVAVVDVSRVKRGSAYDTLTAIPELARMLKDGEITQKAIAEVVGVSRSSFSEDWATYLMDEATLALGEDWEMDPEMVELLMLGDHDFDPQRDDMDAWIELAIEQFARWRGRFLRTKHGPYLTKEFHKRWLRSLFRAILTGGRLTILSPPRHGKTELLIHFVIWLVSRDPEFACMWISVNEKIAKLAVAEGKRIMETNTELIAATLGPHRRWQPIGRATTSWGATEFTVANRSASISNKAPTMVAIGRAGGVLSRDVDLIVTDDIEDFKSTQQAETREATRNWAFNDVESRKEEHTAWLNIGSRQHTDDIHSYLLEDDEWEVIVDTAHDPDCVIEETDFDAHVDCMLFPEVRSYRWLRGKLRTARSQGLEANFEMVYLNDPRPTGMTVFDAERIELAKNHRRGLGLEAFREAVARARGTDHIDVGYHLVAGLDPSASGYQAAFLWAWVRELNRLYVIDIDNRKGGGVYQFLELIVEWFEEYELTHWVWENNIMTEADLLQNTDVRNYINANGIYLEPHNTQGSNRNNPAFGVGSMSGLYDSDPPMVDLAWGTDQAKEKVGQYVRQMTKFTDTANTMGRVKRKTDILMASWFPMKVIRRFRKEAQASEDAAADGASYAEFEQTEWNEVPW